MLFVVDCCLLTVDGLCTFYFIHFTFYNKNEKYIPHNEKRISDSG